MTHVLTRLDYDDVAADVLGVSDDALRLQVVARTDADEDLEWHFVDNSGAPTPTSSYYWAEVADTNYTIHLDIPAV